MDYLRGRVTDEELRYDRDGEGVARDVTVTIGAEEFDGNGEQFERGEKVVVARNPVEDAIEAVREGN